MAVILGRELKNLERYQRILTVITTTLLIGGVGILVFVSLGRGILPAAIEITPQRFLPFEKPVCPGETAYRSITYNINRPSVLEVDAVIYDVGRKRPIPETAMQTSRPSPYELRETMPFTFSVPDLPPGDYEWQVAITPKNQNAEPAFWFIAFEVAGNCPMPTSTPTPEP